MRNKASRRQFTIDERHRRMLWELLFDAHSEFVADDDKVICIHHSLQVV
jgi:hypothetical protein